jgi:hypothetical protein
MQRTLISAEQQLKKLCGLQVLQTKIYLNTPGIVVPMTNSQAFFRLRGGL